MADSNLQAGPSQDPIAELGQPIGQNHLQQKSEPTDKHSREKSGSDDSLELPRVRLGGMAIVMTIISFLLASSAGFFGYRAIFASNSTSPSVSAVKASREPNKIALAPATSQDQFDDRQAAVATGSIKDQSTPAPHVIATIPIKTNSEVGTAAAAASSALVASNSAPPRGAELSEAPASSAAARRVGRNRPPSQVADTAVGSAANNSAASEAPAVSHNGFAVQIASERSQSKAQASFRRLQTRYPNQLHDHQPVIRRADLGAGTYYRALVGPFASRDVAIELCSALKAAGGDCIIQKI
jgi:hypothetical protein